MIQEGTKLGFQLRLSGTRTMVSSTGEAGKESACNAGDLGSIPGLRSPGEGKGYPLQYSGLENSMDYTVHGVTKSRTRLSDFHFSSLHYITPPETEQDPAGVPFQGQSLLSTLPRPTLGIPSLLFP